MHHHTVCGLTRKLTALLLAVLLTPTPAARPASPADALPLTLERAVTLALAAEDPSLARLEARAEALEERAIAAAQLPDPVITTELANVPTDTFALNQADMTQLRIGLRQQFPPGRSLAIRGQRARSEADVERARRQLALRQIALTTRSAWFELCYQQRAVDIVSASRAAVARQVESLSAQFATGRMHAQDLHRIELELSLIDDRLAEHERLAQIARAELARYLGAAAQQPLPEQQAQLAPPPDRAQLVARLEQHPALAVETAQMRVAESEIELAAQAYRPALALEGGYGLRQDRPDFASIGISVTMPLFTARRQDRRHAAAVRERGAEQLDRDTVLLDLRRQLEQAVADWQRYTQRIELYRGAVREHARMTAEGSITTYTNGQTDFAEVIRSQIAELDTALMHAELEARAGQAWSRIVYLTGADA